LTGSRWLNGAIGGVNVVLAVASGLQTAYLARRLRVSVVMSAVGDGHGVIAGAIGAKLAGVPHVIWVFDLWEENSHGGIRAWLASQAEGSIWRGADAILVHSDLLAGHYWAKHGISCLTLPTPVDIYEESPRSSPPDSQATGPAEVLIAGSIYWAQEEAVQRVARVCEDLEGVRLTLVGDPTLRQARAPAVDSAEPALPPAALAERLSRADVLFLGLSFGTDHPELIRTATPARLPEYMASGTPILVNAPPGSHVAEYARAEDFAEVVDKDDDQAVKEALLRLLDDRPLSRRRAVRARELAVARHRSTSVSRCLAAVIAEVANQADPYDPPQQ